MFLLDTNIFIQCYRCNPPQVFPSFWGWFEANGLDVQSINAVFNEIDRKNDWLASWAKERKQNGFFLDNEAQDVQRCYRDIANYTYEHYPDESERDRFLNGADPWLIASALSWNCEILTFETPAGSTSQRPKIPNVASHFNVRASNFFDFLYNQGIKF